MPLSTNVARHFLTQTSSLSLSAYCQIFSFPVSFCTSSFTPTLSSSLSHYLPDLQCTVKFLHIQILILFQDNYTYTQHKLTLQVYQEYNTEIILYFQCQSSKDIRVRITRL
jgi:hypothetical protein